MNKKRFRQSQIQGFSYTKTDGPGIEVGLKLYKFCNSFTYKTSPKELLKTAKTYGEANTEIC